MRTVARILVAITCVAGLAALWSRPGRAQNGGTAPETWTKAVPRATCGPKDRIESGLQGQTTLAERMTGGSETAYNCNLELVGQVRGEGASWQMAAFDTCAYYGTANGAGQQRKGVVVIDASNPSQPVVSTYLDSRPMWDPWESLKVNAQRKLLAGVQADGGAGVDPGFAVYDISTCAKPVLKAAVNLPSPVRGHAGNFAPDGMTYYGSHIGVSIYPIDLRNPAEPKLLDVWHGGADNSGLTHDMGVSENGARLYSAQVTYGIGGPSEQQAHRPPAPGNGLVIVDVSDYQARKANAQPKIVGQLLWNDGAIAQEVDPFTVNGRPYVMFTDELGSGGRGGAKAACAQNLPPFAFARIIDISDERNPKLAAQLKLEVDDPANCASVLADAHGGGFGYSSHYCTLDNPAEARFVACSYFEAGVRVFDIQNPYRPKEIAYYKPPARQGAIPGSYHAVRSTDKRTTDWASSNLRWLRSGNDTYLWFTSMDNGFQIVRFTNTLASIGQSMAGRDPLRDPR
jgi:hypothetical protein